ncbi:MAG: glycosyltransferase family 2 protein [Proteobacteria bacterium]|nr:glycosyltransferase family 2 protein [Pseudomonadota bacterium]
MRISVVIPACNAAAFLGEALASVAAQTAPADEVIVVDDGSTDATAAVAAKHGARVISTPNRGVSAARNTGIAAAQGDWIALLDADDLWHPEKLARQIAAAALAPEVGVIVCDHYRFAHGGAMLSASLFAERRARFAAMRVERLANGVLRLRDMGIGLVTLGMAFFPSVLLLRRELVLANGGFDETLQRCEDYEFLLRLFRQTDALAIDAPLMGYRVHPDGISRQAEAMTLSLVALGDRIAAHPERYASGLAGAFMPRQREALLDAAKFALKRGDRPSARALIARAGAIRRDPRWAALNLASHLPPGSIAALSALKRRLAPRH